MFGSAGSYRCLKDLGDGYSGSVVLAIKEESEKQVALKVPNPEKLLKFPKIRRMIAHEFEVLSKLVHPHIVTPVDFQENVPYVQREGDEPKNVPILALELVENGELCTLVCNQGRLPENSARFFFRQLVEALDYLHGQNFAHRDLKPENILIDSNWEIKVIDFAFAVRLGHLETALVGTPGYLAPEMYLKKGYSPEKVDIFAAGVILFIMVRGIPPFNDTSSNDPHYSVFAKSSDFFWKYHRGKDPNSPWTCQFMDLFNRMCEPDPKRRISMKEIIAHRYFTDPIDEDLAKRQVREMKESTAPINAHA